MLKLPNAEKSWVPSKKLTDYLLSTTHPVGSAKAAFFRSLGYSESNTDLLAEGLCRIAREGDLVETRHSPFGEKHVVEGTLRTPSNESVTVRTVWIIEYGENDPRFVTAMPA